MDCRTCDLCSWKRQGITHKAGGGGGGSGTVITRVHTTSETYTTQYIHNAVYDDGTMTAVKATQLGLLRGLRMCVSHECIDVGQL